MQWASIKYTAPIEQGRQGNKLPRNSDAERAMYRVLELCFPTADKPVSTPKATANKVDNVAKMLKAYAKLTKAEQKRFLASV